MLRYLRQMLRGWLPEKPGAGEDLLQLGGDFVLDGEQRIVFAYRSREATDRPPATAILEAVRQAAASRGSVSEERRANYPPGSASTHSSPRF
jgi:hypothetical protein